MLSRLTARMAFAIAIGLLLACAIIVYSTLRNFVASEQLVYHTQHVLELAGKTESDIAAAARNRLTYVFDGGDEALNQYRQAVAQIPTVVRELSRETADNPAQQENCARLEKLVNDRIQIWEKSVELKKSGAPSPASQTELTRQSVVFADEIVNITRGMRTEESGLLQSRIAAARGHFMFVVAFLIVAFTTAVLLLFWHYRLIRDELHARETAEQAASRAALSAIESERKARESEQAAVSSHEAARRLSARLLQLQDDERRKFSRELHDSIGQHLAAAKMVLAPMAAEDPNDRRRSDALNLIDQSIKEARTISHLLHPPGLDEAGFSSAATWYAEGFSNRSGLNLKIQIAELPHRLPREIEIALFRVLQESLTNIHRHSRSTSAEVSFAADHEQATLRITDHGTGIAKDVLTRFQSLGTSGVGLAGMRERIRELGGKFEVQSNSGGTSVQVVVPVFGERASTASPS
jgi:signal transduction histidine kinase